LETQLNLIELVAFSISNFFNIYNILAVFFGIIVGIFVGSLPGMTATMSIALMVPLTFNMDPVTSICLLLGVYKGGVYGGSISAILINTPGTAAAAATVIDGYEMAKQGKAGKALKIAIYSSVIADITSDIITILVCVPIASVAIRFGPPEFSMVILFSVTIIGLVSGRSVAKGIIAGFGGLLLATVGLDPIMGTERFTFGSITITQGLAFIPMLIGLYGGSELMVQAESTSEKQRTIVQRSTNYENNRVSWIEFKGCLKSIFRAGLIGTFIGALPGIGSAVSAFVNYGLAKKESKHPEEFGKGAIEGVAAAEAGNNSVCGATMIPLLTLGVPGDTVTAVMLGAFLIQGITPGPMLFEKSAPMVYTIFVGMVFCNFVNFIVAFSGVKLFSKIVKVQKSIIFPIVAILCVVGTYAINNSLFDVICMFLFGILGYFMRRFGFPLAPVNIGFIMGTFLETSVRQSLIISQGNPFIFITHPIALAFLILTILMVFVAFRFLKKLR
jgi:putative tricarboxylic transport membrane protein